MPRLKKAKKVNPSPQRSRSWLELRAKPRTKAKVLPYIKLTRRSGNLRGTKAFFIAYPTNLNKKARRA